MFPIFLLSFHQIGLLTSTDFVILSIHYDYNRQPIEHYAVRTLFVILYVLFSCVPALSFEICKRNAEKGESVNTKYKVVEERWREREGEKNGKNSKQLVYYVVFIFCFMYSQQKNRSKKNETHSWTFFCNGKMKTR